MKNQDILRVAGESGCSPVTVRRWLESPSKVMDRSRERIEAAVKKLRLKLERVDKDTATKQAARRNHGK